MAVHHSSLSLSQNRTALLTYDWSDHLNSPPSRGALYCLINGKLDINLGVVKNKNICIVV